MKNTKKWFLKLSVVTGLLLSSIGVNQFAQASEENKSAPIINIVEKNDFLVLDNNDKENESTIVCEAKENEDFGIKNVKGELACQNLFDYADFTVLTKEEAKGFKVGDILQITFDGDNVEKVVKNKDNIENKVIGQKINNKVDVLSYVIKSVKNNDIIGLPIDHVSNTNSGIYLSKKDLNIKVKTGDTIIITFGEKHDNIINVKNLDNDNLTYEQFKNMPKYLYDNGKKLVLAEDGTYLNEDFYK